jgi:hypothetical protein
MKASSRNILNGEPKYRNERILLSSVRLYGLRRASELKPRTMIQAATVKMLKR